ncbi:esterase/lipase family protein [Streptomyces sp. MH13]|uniref:esterase/lipase family protein n=1 Tax=unclassified Streptomyces TaxID=2593676 RepID=UPI003CF7BF4A
MRGDLVVVVPGIMGTALTRDGHDVWDLSLQAIGGILGSARTKEMLKLQKDIRDDDPEPPHALDVGGAIFGPRLLPGLISDIGYAGLRRKLGIEEDRFVVFPYDWRLSNRNSARKLRRFVDERLSHWRETADPALYPGAGDAKVVFLCRSMGGLVVRYYTEVLGGWEKTRSVTTLGTPFSGSVKALRFLTGQARWVPGPLNEQIREICSTYPSLGQLIPTYRIVLDPEDGRVALDSRTPLEGVDPWMIEESGRFFTDIDNAIQKNDALYGRHRYALFAFGGDKHRTDQAISFPMGSKPRFHSDFSKSTDLNDRYLPSPRGDGTVSHLAQTPPEWSSTGQPLWLDSRHADLMNADKAIEQLKRICDDVPLAQALSSEYPVGVELPDVAVAGEPFEMWATNAEAALRLRVRRLAENGRCVWDEEMRPCGDGTFRAEARAESGRWTLEVYSPTVRYVCRDVILVV